MDDSLVQSSHDAMPSTITIDAQDVNAPNAQSVAAPNAPNAAAPLNVAAGVVPVPEAMEDGFNEYKRARKRPKKTSPVWEHFTELVVKKKLKAQCKYCKDFFAGESASGMSHLKRHLKVCSSRVNHDISNFLVKSNDHGAAGNTTGSLKCYKFCNDELRRCIVLFVVGGSHLLTIVEQKEFRYMMSRANPQFNSFSRHTLKRIAHYLC